MAIQSRYTSTKLDLLHAIFELLGGETAPTGDPGGTENDLLRGIITRLQALSDGGSGGGTGGGGGASFDSFAELLDEVGNDADGRFIKNLSDLGLRNSDGASILEAWDADGDDSGPVLQVFLDLVRGLLIRRRKSDGATIDWTLPETEAQTGGSVYTFASEYWVKDRYDWKQQVLYSDGPSKSVYPRIQYLLFDGAGDFDNTKLAGHYEGGLYPAIGDKIRFVIVSGRWSWDEGVTPPVDFETVTTADGTGIKPGVYELTWLPKEPAFDPAYDPSEWKWYITQAVTMPAPAPAFKRFAFELHQVGTGIPNATVRANPYSTDYEVFRSGIGNYRIQWTSSQLNGTIFPITGTLLLTGTGGGDAVTRRNYYVEQDGSDAINIFVYDDTGTFHDLAGQRLYIELNEYPT